jgi:hypothetical protein
LNDLGLSDLFVVYISSTTNESASAEILRERCH